MLYTKISRSWNFITNSSNKKEERILWDYGNEVWELELKTNELRHFQIFSREYTQPTIMEEVVILLPESTIPAEAIRHVICSDWIISEKGIECIEQLPLPPLPIFPQPTHTGLVRERPQMVKHQKSKDLQPPLHSSSQKVSPPPLKNSKKAKKNDDSSSDSASSSAPLPSNYPKHLWSSLSQWIPPTALYQPSLHQQAVLEMSEKSVRIHISPKHARFRSSHSSSPLFL